MTDIIDTELDAAARDLLASAAQDLRDNGWYQGDYYESPAVWELSDKPPQACPACAYGAMYRVTGLTFNAAANTSALLLAESLLGEEVGMIAPWNDREERTADEVIAAFEKVAGPEALARRDGKSKE